MFDLCAEYGVAFDITFNQKNYFLLQFGLECKVLLPVVLLSNVVLQWVTRL